MDESFYLEYDSTSRNFETLAEYFLKNNISTIQENWENSSKENEYSSENVDTQYNTNEKPAVLLLEEEPEQNLFFHFQDQSEIELEKKDIEASEIRQVSHLPTQLETGQEEKERESITSRQRRWSNSLYESE